MKEEPKVCECGHLEEHHIDCEGECFEGEDCMCPEFSQKEERDEYDEIAQDPK